LAVDIELIKSTEELKITVNILIGQELFDKKCTPTYTDIDLSGAFASHNSLNQGGALSPVLFNHVSEYYITNPSSG
jgi:hypothetical protein